ncbi:MAG: hypothetical protein COB24_08955 [Hyphomicrobiales bacterium]|nr:MAG: hypothetical protein COB24_08955 [Hyphomicrobiales bacterium]
MIECVECSNVADEGSDYCCDCIYQGIDEMKECDYCGHQIPRDSGELCGDCQLNSGDKDD